MTSVATFAGSSVGKKVLVAITGLMLFGFVIVHLIGNFTLFIPDGGEAFNDYAHFLETLIHGWMIIGFEIGLIAIAIVHVIYAVIVALIDKERARPDKYALIRNAGGKSHKSLASRFMIITGPIILIFAGVHIWMFKFAPELQNAAHGEVKDLYSVVDRAFSVPWIVAAFMIVMVLLGTHLWHGVWSALQSLGLNSDRHIKLLTRLSMVAGVVLGIGFLVLPLYMYFTGPGGH